MADVELVPPTGETMDIGTTDEPISDIVLSGKVQTASDAFFYIGDSGTDGSWRIGRSGNNMVMERRESGNWVTKQTIQA